jgi:Flp pilus assembly protein TadD
MPFSRNALRSFASRACILSTVGLLALATAGCLRKGAEEVTGSISASAPASPEAARREAQVWGAKFDANPADAVAALRYAQALRASDQKAQAVAVLQQAAIRSPNHPEIGAAYGKALAEVGRLKEAAEVLSSAHSPERPDWRILSTQGAVADQMGDHAQAQSYYEAALKIVPGEPTVLSNLGLSYALSNRLAEADRTLRQAASQPRADARVRQNLALVLGLQGKFVEAEETLRRDLSPADAAANLAVMKKLISQPNRWNAIRSAAGQSPAKRAPSRGAEASGTKS